MARKTKPTPRRKRKSEESHGSHRVWWGVGWAALACLWVLVLVALATYSPTDAPTHANGVTNAHVHNWVGQFGAYLSSQAYTMLGPGVWVLMIGWGAYLGMTATGQDVNQLILRGVGLVLMAVTVSALVGVIERHLGSASSPPEGPGGLLAVYIDDHLLPRFSTFGTSLILLLVFWVGALLTADRLVLAIPRALGHLLLKASNVRMPSLPRPALALPGGRANDLDEEIDTQGQEGTSRRKRKRRDETIEIDEDAGGLGATESFGLEEQPALAAANEEQEDDDEEQEAGDAPGAYMAEKEKFDPDALREKMAQLPINFAPNSNKNLPPVEREIDMSGYQFPGMDLLEEPEGDFTAEQERVVRDQAVQLESALQEYKISGEVVGIDSGPVITLFEVRLAPGTKVSALSAVDSDLARALKAQNIRIVPNMEGKNTVGVEVPNAKKERVRLKELMTVGRETMEKMRLPMYLGKDASGTPLIQDLTKMPHMLIAGTTGSGKSVCMNSIIMSFLFTKRPDELKLVLVDPKMVEMSMFKDIPHLMCPVVTEMSKATAILEWAVTKMDERYELLAEAGVRDIATYNGLAWEEIKERMEPASEEEEARIPKKLPYLVFVIDELADLMMTNKEVEGSIVRIAQKARAVGIHLILATQRPQANVVTGLIKSNMPGRIAFKVASGMDSRIVLDQKGGELLLGQGDMLFLSPSSHELTRAQGTLVDDSEVRLTIKFLKGVAQQNFEPQLVQIKNGGANVNGMGKDPVEEARRDPLFDEAVKVVIETGRGSVSLLQRRLTIGYGRAARLIEAMGETGVIGEYKGTQSREVNISREEWDAMKAQAAADAKARGEVDEDQEGQAVDEDEAFEVDDEMEEQEQAYEQQDADEDEDEGVPDEMKGEHRR